MHLPYPLRPRGEALGREFQSQLGLGKEDSAQPSAGLREGPWGPIHGHSSRSSPKKCHRRPRPAERKSCEIQGSGCCSLVGERQGGKESKVARGTPTALGDTRREWLPGEEHEPLLEDSDYFRDWPLGLRHPCRSQAGLLHQPQFPSSAPGERPGWKAAGTFPKQRNDDLR